MKYSYKFKFYINAKHSVTFGNVQSKIHPHTWEIVIYVVGKSNTMLNFTTFERTIQNYLEQLEGTYLNELEVFKNIEPTMENLGLVLNKTIKKATEISDLDLKRLEISENPSRTYIIEN